MAHAAERVLQVGREQLVEAELRHELVRAQPAALVDRAEEAVGMAQAVGGDGAHDALTLMRARDPATRPRAPITISSTELSPLATDPSVGVAAAPFAACVGSSERAGALAVGLVAAASAWRPRPWASPPQRASPERPAWASPPRRLRRSRRLGLRRRRRASPRRRPAWASPPPQASPQRPAWASPPPRAWPQRPAWLRRRRLRRGRGLRLRVAGRTTSVAVAAAAFAVCAGSAERAGAFAVGLVAAGFAPAGFGFAAAGFLPRPPASSPPRASACSPCPPPAGTDTGRSERRPGRWPRPRRGPSASRRPWASAPPGSWSPPWARPPWPSGPRASASPASARRVLRRGLRFGLGLRRGVGRAGLGGGRAA